MFATRLDTVFYRRKRKVAPSTNPAMQSETKRVQLLEPIQFFLWRIKLSHSHVDVCGHTHAHTHTHTMGLGF